MGKIISTILLAINLFVPSLAFAEERVVQMNLSGCADCNATTRIEKILKQNHEILMLLPN